MALIIRKPWTIPNETDDGPARRRLDDELENWRKLGGGARSPGVRTEPDRGRELREVAKGFAPGPTDILGIQEAAFSRPEDVQAGLQDVGARRASEFGEALRALSPHEQAKVKAISTELNRLGVTAADLAGYAAQNRPRFEEVDRSPPAGLSTIADLERGGGKLSDEQERALIAWLPERERGQFVLGRIDEAVRKDEAVQAARPEPGAQYPEGSFPREVLERGVQDPIEAMFGAEYVRKMESRGGQQEMFMRIVADVITWGGSEVALQLIDGDIEGAIEMAALVGVPVTAIHGLTLAARSARETKAIQQVAREAMAGRAARGAPLETQAVRRGVEVAEAAPARVPEVPARLAPGQEAVPGDVIRYHGTTKEGADRIMREGFAPGEVFLTDSPGRALEFGARKGDAAFVEVRVRPNAIPGRGSAATNLGHEVFNAADVTPIRGQDTYQAVGGRWVRKEDAAAEVARIRGDVPPQPREPARLAPGQEAVPGRLTERFGLPAEQITAETRIPPGVSREAPLTGQQVADLPVGQVELPFPRTRNAQEIAQLAAERRNNLRAVQEGAEAGTNSVDDVLAAEAELAVARQSDNAARVADVEDLTKTSFDEVIENARRACRG